MRRGGVRIAPKTLQGVVEIKPLTPPAGNDQRIDRLDGKAAARAWSRRLRSPHVHADGFAARGRLVSLGQIAKHQALVASMRRTPRRRAIAPGQLGQLAIARVERARECGPSPCQTPPRPLDDPANRALYLIFLGGPYAAAVFAKTIVTSRVNNGTLQKTDGTPNHLSDVVSNDAGAVDLFDLQYTLFNLIVLAAVIGAFSLHPADGLPEFPISWPSSRAALR